MKTSILLTLAAALTLPLSLHAESRTWTDAESGKTIEGELVSVDGEKVTLKRADGKTFTLDASRFSADDQEYIAAHDTPSDADADADTDAPADADADADGEATPAGTENDVTLSGVHLCCSGCEKSIEKAIADLEDVKVDISRSSKSINFTSEKSSAIQAAIDAVAKAGYYGKSNVESIAIAAPKGTSADKTQSAEIGGLHICCGKCESSIDDALSAIDGVETITIDKKGGKVTVEGEFSTAEAVTALQNAGLNGKL
jgi:copper chaperone CopZ